MGVDESTGSLCSVSNINLPKIFVKSESSRKTLKHFILHAADVSNPVRPFVICKKWSDLVMEEFEMQGEQELKHGYPLSPNMGKNVDQSQSQIQFTRLIVQPLFEVMMELFPKTIVFMDLCSDNIRQWSGENAATPSRRKKSSALRNRKVFQSDPRRLSLSAGTVEIPDQLQKFFSSKSIKPVHRNSFRINAAVEEEEIDESMDDEGDIYAERI